MASDEFNLIDRYFRQRQLQDSNVEVASGSLAVNGVSVGIGDDCALLDLPSQHQLAVSMDTLVAGVHFLETASAYDVAQRALRTNLSDLAAMGAKPLWFTLGLTIPDLNDHWLESFSQGLFDAANEFDVSLVGGDTTRGPLSITIQVHGAVKPNQALRRSEASVGDHVYVTGSLGDGAAALAVLQQQKTVSAENEAFLIGRFYQPRPHIKEGLLLAGVATSAIDISDGLLADLGHICQESSVAAELDWPSIPTSAAFESIADDDLKFQWALCGGDDYRLCFTVAPEKLHIIESLQNHVEVRFTKIGYIVAGKGVRCFDQGKEINLSSKGYNHFDSH